MNSYLLKIDNLVEFEKSLSNEFLNSKQSEIHNVIKIFQLILTKDKLKSNLYQSYHLHEEKIQILSKIRQKLIKLKKLKFNNNVFVLDKNGELRFNGYLIYVGECHVSYKTKGTEMMVGAFYSTSTGNNQLQGNKYVHLINNIIDDIYDGLTFKEIDLKYSNKPEYFISLKNYLNL